jgi:hypothetical protein
MELKSNSFIAHYYRFMFNDKLPKDFCTLFWNTLISIILFPVAISAAIPLWKYENWDDRKLISKFIHGLFIWIGSFIFSLFGYAILIFFKLKFINYFPFLLQYITGLVALVLLIGIIISIAFLIGLIIQFIRDIISEIKERRYVQKYGDNLNPQVNKTSNIKIMWGTIRNKYCTKIDWK